ncbi:hypothetical protein HYZ76_01360 [Candidatus Falkowbacteria bacterium]|nr:hypothetical protein [Candidatus Falkowbacteria bacterium]
MDFKKINLIIVAALILANFTAINLAGAGTADTVIGGLDKTVKEAGFPQNGDAPRNDFVTAWSFYTIGLASILSALFLLLVIYGGWLWMSARGNEEQVARAKKIVIAAVIGLAFVIAARLIAELALDFLEEAAEI